MINSVAIIKTRADYTVKAPFDPEGNHVYQAVRQAFEELGMDAANIGKKTWNPFKDIIKSGDHVVIKPNLVLHINASGKDFDAVVTQAAVIRPVVDFALLALQGKGRISIADAPQMNCDFEKLIAQNGLLELMEYYKKQSAPVELLDLRREMTIYRYGIVWERVKLKGDPLGYREVDLGSLSEMVGEDQRLFYGADYNRSETRKAHSRGHHRYLLAGTILDADVFINMPKMKVHKKSGVTLNLKNLVGVNGNKNHIIHYHIGNAKRASDEFSTPSWLDLVDRFVKDLFLSGKRWSWGKYPYVPWSLFYYHFRNPEIFDKGNWHGNNTIWKVVLDLNRALLYADKEGKLHKTPQRHYFSVVDGIVGGQDEGPLAPTPFSSGIIAAGNDPVSIDYQLTLLMGLDYQKIPLMTEALKRDYLFKKLLPVVSNEKDIAQKLNTQKPIYHFRPPKGWLDHIEL